MRKIQNRNIIKRFGFVLATLLGLSIFYVNGGNELNIFAKGYLLTFELKLIFLLALGLTTFFKFKPHKS